MNCEFHSQWSTEWLRMTIKSSDDIWHRKSKSNKIETKCNAVWADDNDSDGDVLVVMRCDAMLRCLRWFVSLVCRWWVWSVGQTNDHPTVITSNTIADSETEQIYTFICTELSGRSIGQNYFFQSISVFLEWIRLLLLRRLEAVRWSHLMNSIKLNYEFSRRDVFI